MAASVLTNGKVSITGSRVVLLGAETWPEQLRNTPVVQCITTVGDAEIIQWFLVDDATIIAALAENIPVDEVDPSTLDETILVDQMQEVAAGVVEALMKSLSEHVGMDTVAGETQVDRVDVSVELLATISQEEPVLAIMPQLEIAGHDPSASWLIVPCDLARDLLLSDPAGAESDAALEPDTGVPPEQLARVLNIRVPVVATLARKKMRVSDILRFGAGAILEFDKSYTEPLELSVGGRTLGTGEAVRIGERFGLKVLEIGPVEARIRSLGGGD